MANSIVKSPLVKTAIYGKDANWGRIVCAVGYSAIPNLDPSRVNLWFGALHAPDLQLHLFKNGEPYDVNEKVASTILENEDLLVHVDLGEKQGHVFSMYTCDMSHEYISINADYRYLSFILIQYLLKLDLNFFPDKLFLGWLPFYNEISLWQKSPTKKDHFCDSLLDCIN